MDMPRSDFLSVCGCVFAHHAASEVCLNRLRLCVSEVENVKLCTCILQDSFTVQHALLKVGWFLEQLEFRVDLPEFPLHRVRNTLLVKHGSVDRLQFHFRLIMQITGV